VRTSPQGKVAQGGVSFYQGSMTMKRLHVHVSVADLDESVRFYSTLFAVGPTKG
jgi:hypothetical protein